MEFWLSDDWSVVYQIHVNKAVRKLMSGSQHMILPDSNINYSNLRFHVLNISSTSFPMIHLCLFVDMTLIYNFLIIALQLLFKWYNVQQKYTFCLQSQMCWVNVIHSNFVIFNFVMSVNFCDFFQHINSVVSF